ncbi:rod shape-determining protein MreD [Streptomyces olivaceiscleroticus]|uniref:Rod shape-determining protein MreD n=1 Tax=Streptomyces olivaceiscleroticus TaxID=68245 RepID=A0ABP3KRV1_9ACTN
MRINRILLSTVLVAVALVVQVGVLARLHLPGAVPDLVLLVVLGLSMVYGHVAGAFIGFGAGLLADLAPPSDHAIGRYALVLCVIGYVAGLTRPDKSQHRSASMPLIVVVCAAIGSTLLYAGVGSLAGDNAGHTVGIPLLLFTATVYDLVLAPFSVPLVMALARRSEKALAGESSGGTQSGPMPGEAAYGWLSTGSGLRMSRSGRGGRTPRIGSQRGGLLSGRSNKPARLKGVKRL